MAITIQKLQPEVLSLPNIPKPLHGVNPRTIKGDIWWEEVRHIVIEDAMGRCLCCGVSKHNAMFKRRLECHEIYKTDYRRGICKYVKTIPLCYSCHAFIHSGFLWQRYESQQMHRNEIIMVMDHGLKILKDNNLQMFPGTATIAFELQLPIAKEIKIYTIPKFEVPWGDWRLIFGGKKYPPKFKNYVEWKRHYITDDADLYDTSTEEEEAFSYFR